MLIDVQTQTVAEVEAMANKNGHVYNDEERKMLAEFMASERISTGVYLAGLNWESWVPAIDQNRPNGFKLDYPEFDQELYVGVLNKTRSSEEDGFYFGAYGVCNSPKQFMEWFGDKLLADVRKFVIVFTHIQKIPDEVQGWRWHKWGPYLGLGNPTTEYLADEAEFADGVYVYHIHQVE